MFEKDLSRKDRKWLKDNNLVIYQFQFAHGFTVCVKGKNGKSVIPWDWSEPEFVGALSPSRAVEMAREYVK